MLEDVKEEKLTKSDAKTIYEWAKCLMQNKNQKNVNTLQDLIIKIGDPEYCFLFARDIRGANVDKLETVGIKNYIKKFARIKKEKNVIETVKNWKYNPSKIESEV